VDANGDEEIDEFDLRAFGLASKVTIRQFYVNP